MYFVYHRPKIITKLYLGESDNFIISRCCFAETAKKCTKNHYNARAQPLCFPVTVAVVLLLNSRTLRLVFSVCDTRSNEFKALSKKKIRPLSKKVKIQACFLYYLSSDRGIHKDALTANCEASEASPSSVVDR